MTFLRFLVVKLIYFHLIDNWIEKIIPHYFWKELTFYQCTIILWKGVRIEKIFTIYESGSWVSPSDGKNHNCWHAKVAIPLLNYY